MSEQQPTNERQREHNISVAIGEVKSDPLAAQLIHRAARERSHDPRKQIGESEAFKDTLLSSPTPEDFMMSVTAASRRLQYGNQLPPEEKQLHQQALTTIQRIIELLYDQNGTPVNEQTKHAILANLRRTTEQTVGAEFQDYVKRQVIAASFQQLTPEEASEIVGMADSYLNRYTKQVGLDSNNVFLQARRRLEQVANQKTTDTQQGSLSQSQGGILQHLAGSQETTSQTAEREWFLKTSYDYIKANWDRFRSMDIESIEQAIREEYYDQPDMSYSEESPKTAEAMRRYQGNFPALLRQLHELKARYPSSYIDVNENLLSRKLPNGKAFVHWFYVNGGKGIPTPTIYDRFSTEDYGRIYQHLKPGAIGPFLAIAEKALAERLDFQLKTINPRDLSARDFQRSDQAVLYFKRYDEEKILRIIEEVYSQYKHAFLPGLPRFIAPLKTGEGKIMEGIGFGQNPKYYKGGEISLGRVRAKWLAQVIDNLKQQGNIADSAAFKGLYTSFAVSNNIDPNSPAFNTQGRDLFPSITKRIE